MHLLAMTSFLSCPVCPRGSPSRIQFRFCRVHWFVLFAIRMQVLPKFVEKTKIQQERLYKLFMSTFCLVRLCWHTGSLYLQSAEGTFGRQVSWMHCRSSGAWLSRDIWIASERRSHVRNSNEYAGKHTGLRYCSKSGIRRTLDLTY